jgi:hypothetical protein
MGEVQIIGFVFSSSVNQSFASGTTLDNCSTFVRPFRLERQFWNQTFQDDVEVCVEEIRQLLDPGDDCGEGVEC